MLNHSFPPHPILLFRLSSESPLLRGKALETIKDKRCANVGAIKPDGVVNMVSSLQEDVEFGGLLHIVGKCSFQRITQKRRYDLKSVI